HDSLVQIWTMTGTTPLLLKGHVGPVLAVAWSGDGRKLASGGTDGSLRLWSDDGTPGPIVDIGGGPVNALAWSPDGRRLASAGDDGTIRIWNLAGLRMDRVLVPTAAVKVAVLDRAGQVVHSTPGAERDLIAYQVSPRG